MINYIWGFFLVIGIIYSFLSGNSGLVNKEILNSASNSIDMVFKLIPVLCLWMGLMGICKDSGLLDKLSKKLTPVIRVLFPEIPKNHDAITFIASNIIMNIFGLGNAATPFGLKAMKSLQELNEKKDTASRSMITFLVINTASVTIIPTTVISLRMANGSASPTDIVLASIITTILSCLLGLVIDRSIYLFRRHKN